MPTKAKPSQSAADHLAQLQSELAALRERIAGLADAGKDAATEALTDDQRAMLSDISAQIAGLEAELEDRVSAHPILSLLAAFGLGFVLARLMR